MRPSGPGGLPDRYDVAIVGGGPAGLGAALVLGRCRRRVIVVDSGSPRNAASQQVHNYLGLDGISPRHFLRSARKEVGRYDVEVVGDEAVAARGLPPDEGPGPSTCFEVELAGGRRVVSRKLLLATGVRDLLPRVEGVERYYGRGVHHCPYCDGWGHRDGRLVAYGEGRAAVGMALSLRTWSARVTACTDGHPVSAKDRRRLDRNGIDLRTDRIARLDGSGEALGRVEFESGPPLACDALFFNTGHVQGSTLADRLGCEREGEHHVRTLDRQRTCQPGLFLAGDADGDVQFVIVAAAEGATAGVAINRELQDEDRGEATRPLRQARVPAGHRDRPSKSK